MSSSPFKFFCSTENKLNIKLNRQFNCNSENVIYLLQCDKENCRQIYIGETEREIKERIKEHIGYAKNKILHKSTGHHFNLPGHSWQNMKFSVVDKLKSSDKIYRPETEKTFFHDRVGSLRQCHRLTICFSISDLTNQILL